MMFEKKEQKEPQQAQSVGLTPEQLTELIKAAVAEARKPNEYEQRKIDKEMAIERRQATERLEMAKAEVESKAARKRNCPHHNGKKHTWVAQVHAPAGEEPYFIPTCQRCFTQLPKIRCTGDQAMQGIGLDRYQTLDMAALERMAANQHPVAV